MRLLALTLLFLLCGCNSATRKPPTVPPVVTPTGPATAAQIEALSKENAELKESAKTASKLASNAAGAVYGASHANQSNPDGLPKEAVSTNLEEAASALPEVSADEKLKRERDNARILAGELAMVKAEKGQAMSENQALKASLSASEKRLAELELEVKQTREAAEKERGAAAAALRKQFDELTASANKAQAAADQAADEARKSALAKLGYALLGLGSILVLAGAAIAFVSKGLEWERAGIAAAFGGMCFALYWTLNQWWFKWVVLGCIACGLACGIFWLMRERRVAVRNLEADEAEDTLKRIIKVVDELGQGATVAEVRAAMTARMNDNHKALIHELRAESKRTAP